MLTKRLACAALACLCAVLIGCTEARETRELGELRVPLVMRPTEDSRVFVLSSAGQPLGSIVVFVDPGVDERADKEKIGENLEEYQPVPVYWQGAPPTDFVRQVLEREIRHLGMRVTENSAEATRVVKFRLVQFHTEERHTYEAQTRAVFTIADASGTGLWEGAVQGRAERFGRSLSAENYQEVLSDATLRMVGSFLNSEPARKALTQ